MQFPLVTVSIIWPASSCVMAGHHTVYIGVHVPKSYHRRRRHRRKSSHKEKRERADHGAEGDKSDGENADETSHNILKPLSESSLGVTQTTNRCNLVTVPSVN